MKYDKKFANIIFLASILSAFAGQILGTVLSFSGFFTKLFYTVVWFFMMYFLAHYYTLLASKVMKFK